MREHIDSCHKYSKSSAAYPENGTANFNNVANITVDSDSITPQKKKNEKEENIQKYHDIYFDKNESNKSIIDRKKIAPNADKTI